MIKTLPIILYLFILALIIHFANESTTLLQLTNSSFTAVKTSNIFHMFWILPAQLAFRIVFEACVFPFTTIFLSNSHFNQKTNKITPEGQRHQTQITRHLFNLLFNLLIFPAIHFYYKYSNIPTDFSLNFNGSLLSIAQQNTSECIYYQIIIQVIISNYLIDFFYLGGLFDRNCDLAFAIIHHTVTNYLFLIAYFGGVGQFAVISHYLHGLGNILVFCIKISAYLELGPFVKFIQMLMLTVVFFVTRVVSYGLFSYVVYTRFEPKFWVIDHMCLFNGMLYMLHVYSCVMAFKRTISYFQMAFCS